MTEIERITELPGLSARRREAHKGDFGRVLIVGGSRGMVGAVALSANAAFRGGAGLVTFAAPSAVQLTVAALCPCATSIPLACGDGGELTHEAVRQFRKAADGADVLAVGPGMGVAKPQCDIVQAALEQTKPLVLDADALNNLRNLSDWPAMRQCPLVLTPHPGEFARLVGATVADVQADRLAAAAGAVGRWGSSRSGAAAEAPLVCVLKGAATVVTDGRRVFVNDTGNPGMAVGGSGDVLTGLTAALIAQGMSPFDAAILAVNRHGRAGDLAADDLGEVSMTATDLLEYLPAAMKETAQ